MPVAANAAEVTSGQCGSNLTWSYDPEDKTLTIDGSGDMWDYETDGRGAFNEGVDPDKVAPWAYLDFDSLVLGENVTSIGDYAFAYTSMQWFPVWDEMKLKSIGVGAFNHTNLRGFYAPESLRIIEDHAFSGHYECLEFVELNDGLEYIGDGAFIDDFMLEEVVVPDSVKHMGRHAFVCKLLGGYGSYAQEWALLNDFDFEVISVPLSVVQISLPDSVTYTGYPQKPRVDVIFEGRRLAESRDYALLYKNNINAGTASVTVVGRGIYKGTIVKNFAIVKPSIQSARLSKTSFVYSGKAIRPTVKVVSGGKTLRAGVDYVISFKNNTKPGRATLTVSGKGIYAGAKTLNFSIKPQATALSSVKGAKKSLKIRWKKRAKYVTGYQVQCSTSKKFTKKTTVTKTVKKAKTTSLSVKKLKAKKTYYVKVRTYYKDKATGKTFYSSWSKAKKAKTKR